MSNTYVTAITALGRYPRYEGETDVVFTIRWTISGSDGKGHTCPPIQQSTSVEWESGKPFTPYSQLTEAQVLGWIPADQMAQAHAAVDQNLANQIAPAEVTAAPPWAA